MDPRRTGLFVLGLLAIFLAAVGIGSALEPADTDSGVGAHGMEEETHGAHQEPASHAPAGLAVAEDGYALRFDRTHLRKGEPGELRFTVVADSGAPVTGFDELHERRLHLILVRRDGTGFRHLHPEMDAAGAWSVPAEFPAAGAYRVFADFSVGGEQRTLAADLFVSGGEFEARPFPPPAAADTTAGYEVRLRSDHLAAGEPAALTFAVGRDGEPVGDLAPYLGAKGHLVALREGDLAFLHVHPEPGGVGEVPFAATFPSAGRYRLYLQFRHDGTVRTAEFTVEVSR
ncbi:MAG TPA: hypothetical protein VFY48_10225 [Solirubrobacterales bacterium]|nr:hypothetical protein [Solirubrobacterales bacterium]